MQNAAMGAAVTASNAAAVAMTFRVLQLVSTASHPALPTGSAQQMLQSVNSAASQAAPNDQGVSAVCLAEILAFQSATGCLVCDQTTPVLLSNLQLLLPGHLFPVACTMWTAKFFDCSERQE